MVETKNESGEPNESADKKKKKVSKSNEANPVLLLIFYTKSAGGFSLFDIFTRIGLAVIFAVWMLGVSINFLLFNAIKISVGHLRPNFIDTCQPYTNETNWIECELTPEKQNYFFPGDIFKCNKSDVDSPRIVDARCSFYSGHSALSMFCAVFIILYTHSRVYSKHWALASCLMPIFIVFYSIVLSIGSFVAVSRVFDHKHHPLDVAVGYTVGFSTAALAVFFYKNAFFQTEERVENDQKIVRGAPLEEVVTNIRTRL